MAREHESGCWGLASAREAGSWKAGDDGGTRYLRVKWGSLESEESV